MGPVVSTEKEVTLSPSPTKIDDPQERQRRRRKHRRTYSVDQAFAVKPFQRKRPRKTLNSFSKYVKHLKLRVRTLRNENSCLSGKIQDLEDLYDQALKQYNRLKNLHITVDDDGSSDDDDQFSNRDVRNLKWKLMDVFEKEIISLQEKVQDLTSNLNQERSDLQDSRGKACCKFCSERSKGKKAQRK